MRDSHCLRAALGAAHTLHGSVTGTDDDKTPRLMTVMRVISPGFDCAVLLILHDEMVIMGVCALIMALGHE